jgi:hypothetical protein
MPKRTEAELQEYLERKVGKHLRSLTNEQVIALRKQIAVKKLKAIHHVREEFNKLAETTELERQAAAQAMVQSAVDQLTTERQRRAEASIRDTPAVLATIEAITRTIHTLSAQDFMVEANASALVSGYAERISAHSVAIGEHIEETRRILDQEVPRFLGRDLQQVTYVLDEVEDRINELGSLFYQVGSEAREACEEVATTVGDEAVEDWTRRDPSRGEAMYAAISTAAHSVLAMAGGTPVPGLDEAFRGFRDLNRVAVDQQIESAIAIEEERKRGHRDPQEDGASGRSTTGSDPGQARGKALGPGGHEPPAGGRQRPDGTSTAGGREDGETRHTTRDRERAAALDPVTFARQAATQQITNLDLVLGAVTRVIEEVAPAGVGNLVFDLLSDAGARYFRWRVAAAAAELEAPALPPDADDSDRAAATAEMRSAAWDFMTDFVIDPGDLVSALTSALGSISADKVGPTLMTKVADVVVRRLVKYLPTRPRQGVNSHRIEADVAAILSAAALAPRTDPAFDPPQPERPATDAAGVTVKRFLMDWAETDADGQLYWVEMAEGGSGKLYVAGTRRGQFVAVPDAEARFPTKLTDGTPIDALLGAAPPEQAGRAWRVRIKDLVGYIDGEATEFVAVQPHQVADWSRRRVHPAGYAEGTTEIAGTWSRVPGPEGAVAHYLFDDGSGARQWATVDSRAANPQGTVGAALAPTTHPVVSISKLGTHIPTDRPP